MLRRDLSPGEVEIGDGGRFIAKDGGGWRRDVVPGKKVVISMAHHDGSEVGNNGEGLCVEIAKDGVGTPATHEFDDIGIDASA